MQSPPLPPLRRALRAARAAIPASQRTRIAQRITQRIAASGWLRSRCTLALYLSVALEPDTAALLRIALARGCRVYLPRIVSYRERRMQLCRYRGGLLRRNRFGIPEPAAADGIDPRRLDLIFVPTLAFDRAGHRLGAGLGYYDRLLSWRLPLTQTVRPLLIGIAYAQSEQTWLRPQPHDVPLDVVVTETEVIHARGAA